MNKKKIFMIKTQEKRNNAYSTSRNNNNSINFGSSNNKFDNGRKCYYCTSTTV